MIGYHIYNHFLIWLKSLEDMGNILNQLLMLMLMKDIESDIECLNYVFDIKEMVDSIDSIFLDKRVVYAKRDPRRYMSCDSESLIDQDWLTWPEYGDS
jgi:hypothetical protein